MSYHNSPFHPEPLAAFPSGTPDRFPEARHIGELETPMRAHPAAGCPAALMLRERSMRKLTVAMLFMSAAGYGCAAHSQSQGAPGAAAAAASGADREGHFARSANDMSTCVAFVSHERHPELHFDLNVSPPMTVSAKKYQSDEQAIWVAEFHKAGPSETDAFLRMSVRRRPTSTRYGETSRPALHGADGAMIRWVRGNRPCCGSAAAIF